MSGFTQQITTWGTKTADKLQGIRRGVTLKLFGAVILDTPVLTGRARANWRVQIGAPELAVADREDQSGGVALAEVNAAVIKSDGDQPVTLANNLPYIKRLEEGYSKQAPAGMVRKNVARFARLIRIEVAK